MSETIKVTVVDYGKTHLMLRYVDPATGKQKHKTAGTAKHGEAVKAAGKWEAELREGRYVAPINTSWAIFRSRYESEQGLSHSTGSREKTASVFNVLERILGPQKLTDLTAARLSYYQAKMRELGRTEATIKGNLSHIKAALSWAVRMGLLVKVPTIETPRRAKAQKLMKGRPITGEEFERMLAEVEGVVGELAAPSWRHFLSGLWLSGLRLRESLELYWDRDDKLCVDLSGQHPMLRIPAAHEKGNQDRLLPMAPEFCEFLERTPEAERTGRVFRPQTHRPLGSNRIGRRISFIGENARVKVNTTTAGKVKYASAHDLRRSFGERWAARIMPQQLMELMRHESIDTTLRYYVGRNAQATAAVLWAAHRAAGNQSGNLDPKNGVFTG